MLKKNRKEIFENGEIMLEGMIVMIITMIMLVWILGIGFLYYQRYVTTIVTNDAATKIASTYNNPTSDIIMGYITTEALSNRDLYRNFASTSEKSDLRDINEERAKCYIKYVLDKANSSGVVDDVDVKLELISDSLVRKHVKLSVTCSYNTPFNQVLDFFGMGSNNKYSVVACSDCTDIADYVSTVNYGLALSKGTYTKGTGFVDSVIKMINSFVKTYNHLHS